MLGSFGGVVTVENSLFVQSSEFADSIRIATAPGSTFRFNTVVNTSTAEFDAIALTGDGTVAVTSNIFAYNSTNPISGAVVTDSLFDTQGTSDAGSNRIASRSAIFVDLAGGDFHLSASSPARDGGAAGLVSTDYDGNPRPQSVGAQPDIGAFEAP